MEVPHGKRGRGQRGGVLVMFALFTPVLLLLMSAVLDLGNLFVIRAHLQVQADAAALATAADFQPCSNTTITNDVRQYSGWSGSPAYNPIWSANLLQPAINQRIYPDGSGTPDDTNTNAPCTANQVDVKLSDTGIPWYFRVFSPASINAHARIDILEETQIGPGAAPFAITDPTPRSAVACFVNESSGALIASSTLVKNGTTWSSATPVAVAVNTSGIAVRVGLSGNAATSCGDSGATFYDTGGNTSGILHIQGYPSSATAGTATAPIAHQVLLLPGDAGSCSDQYFSNPASSCDVGINAQVDFGTTTLPAGAKIDAVVGGTHYPLVYQGTTGTIETWTGTAGKLPTLSAGAELQVVDLSVTSNAIKKAFTIANTHAASYTAGAGSGPITAATVSENGIGDANSFQLGTSHNLVVSISIPGLTTGPLQTLNVAGNEAICGNGNAKQLIETGCAGNYAIYTGGACNTATSPYTSATPYTCVTTQNGVKANDIAAGMNQRILGSEKPSTCTHPNNWAQYPTLPANDPRILTLFITSYGSGSTQQIEAFATFYVTGWTGQGNGFSNPCQPPPSTWNGSQGGDDAAQATTLVGHFINYVNVQGTGGGTTCVQNSINQCTAILTR